MIGKWERGVNVPRPYHIEILCTIFDRNAAQLGFINTLDEPASYLNFVQSRMQAQELELGDTMANFSPSRRTFLGVALAGATLATFPQGASGGLNHVGEHTLQQFENLNAVCWGLSNDNQLEMTEQILGAYLPKVAAVAQHSSLHRTQAASLAARGYILAAEVDKQNVAAMMSHAQNAVFYSQFSEDYNVQSDALRQEATIALVAKQPFQALLAYQKALMLVDKVTPLLRGRIYLGLASAYARCNPILYKQEALRYLGLASEHFPVRPEDDPWYLYMFAAGNLSVLHLYEALTYNDLDQSASAWEALVKVDGLHPKMTVTESARIEFINLQARTLAHLDDLDESSAYVEAGVKAADASGYSVWREEAFEVYQELVNMWPHELQVRRLKNLFQQVKGA